MFILEILQNNNFIALIAFLFAIILGITVHEFAHAWVAFKCGDPTAKYEGRLTLNPLAHLDLLGTIFLFIVGFGWGKPVPINPNYFKNRSDELKVAFAGIVMNLIVAVIIGIPLRVALLHGVDINTSSLLSFLSVVVEINIILAVFNLIPIPPLDGSHVVEFFLSDTAKMTYQYIGPFVLIGLILLDNLGHTTIIYGIMGPLLRFFSFVATGGNFFNF